MHITFASSHPYLPQIAGGSQSNTHEMAIELMARGHQVSVLSGLTGDGFLGVRNQLLMRLLGRTAIADRGQGYPVYRSWFAWEGAAETARAVRPDVVVAQSGNILRVAKAFRASDVPVVIYLHNVEFEDHGESMDGFRDAVFLANSQFTADRYRQTYGIHSTIINPLFQPERYRVRSSRDRVLFVNPHPLKGVDLAFEIASVCPDIGFDFVESWTLSDEQKTTLASRASQLGNVVLYPRTKDMRVHYGRARLVLVPSRWEETWGRVASEAHYSGIPVLGTRVGGLEEAVGPGGILLDLDAGVEAWSSALRALWNDPVGYDALSQAALNYAARPELDRALQLDRMEAVITGAIQGRRV